MCRILAIIALLFLAQASAQYSYEEHTLCSDRLNDMMSMVCQEFNGILPQKRGMIASSELDPLDPIQYVEAKESHPLFRGRYAGGEGVLNSLAPIRRRTRQGIVDRCCKRTCSYAVLMEYCSIPLI